MEIIKLEPHAKKQASDVMAAAFFDYPMFAPIFPDLKKRAKKMTWFFEKCIQVSLRYGSVFATSDLSGVMLILSPGYTKLTQFDYIKNGFLLLPFIMGLKNYAKFDEYEKFAAKIQESVLNERDCYYIFGLATDPEKQGKGIGSALIKFLIEKADAEKIPIYLRTETKDNARYYEKFGFKVLYNSPAPISDFDIWCMLRDV